MGFIATASLNSSSFLSVYSNPLQIQFLKYISCYLNQICRMGVNFSQMVFVTWNAHIAVSELIFSVVHFDYYLDCTLCNSEQTMMAMH